MNSLNASKSKIARRTILALFIVATFTMAAFTQKVEPSSQGKLYGEPGFRGESINLNVVNADIRDILSYITDQYGINFVIDKSVGQVPVTVKVNEVPWNVALDSVLQSQSLGIQVNGNILRVADSKALAAEYEIQKTVQSGQLDNSPLYTEFLRLNYARAAGTLSGAAGGANQTTTGTMTSGGSGGGGASAASGAGGGSDQGILGIIQKRLSRRGTVEVDGRSNTLIITDVKQNIDSIRQLVAYLDQPEPQVEIEARIVVATRNFSRDIGVQLAGLVTGPRGSGIQGGTLPTTGAPANLPGGTPNGDLASKIANTVFGLTTGVFGTAQISSMISLGEQKGQAKVIATPRVTTLNNRPAEIKSGTKIPITTVQPGSGAGGAIIATTTYVDVPLRLAITPQITDVGTVILNVVAENSSAASIVGGASPAINSQSMTTQVTVPDGGTTVVGGVLFDDERESQDRTPGLASIPLLGHLFKRKGVQRNTNEILFFITPRISRPDYSAAQQSGTAPRPLPLLQPVPLGSPPSNSQPQAETPQPVVLQGPTLVRPDGSPAATPTPIKPNN